MYDNDEQRKIIAYNILQGIHSLNGFLCKLYLCKWVCQQDYMAPLDIGINRDAWL